MEETGGDSGNRSASERLLSAARRLMMGSGSSHIEMRCFAGSGDAANLPVNQQYTAKARRHGLAAEMSEPGQPTEDFYRLYTHDTHDLGTPAHSAGFLGQVLNQFPSSSM